MTQRKMTALTTQAPKGGLTIMAHATCGVDICGAGISSPVVGTMKPTQLVSWARRHGWRKVHDTWFCPKHIETARTAEQVVADLTAEAKAGRWPK